MQEEYLAEEFLDEKKGLKNMCKKGFWVKNLWGKKKNIRKYRDKWNANFRSPLFK